MRPPAALTLGLSRSQFAVRVPGVIHGSTLALRRRFHASRIAHRSPLVSHHPAPLFPRGQKVVLNRTALPSDIRVLALAPHPDDFDCVGVTMRLLRDNGNSVTVVVLTGGASGVEDEYPGARTTDDKVRIRVAEQRASCAFFGLAGGNLHFVRLDEDNTGHCVESDANARAVEAVLREHRPRLICLPHGNDTNADHQRIFRLTQRVRPALPFRPELLLACDPKTIAMAPTVFTVFDEDTAQWKRELLRFHDTQHQRNLHTRGHGIDERILAMNRRIACQWPDLGASYAEAFEVA